MLRQPIQKDNELICPCGCGVVMKSLEETPILKTNNIGTSSLSIHLLGSALENNVKFHSQRDKYDKTYEIALTRLATICQKYGLPEELSVVTMKRIKHKEKGLFSFREQIRQLLKILEKDDYYLYRNKAQMIKKDYENFSGI